MTLINFLEKLLNGFRAPRWHVPHFRSKSQYEKSVEEALKIMHDQEKKIWKK